MKVISYSWKRKISILKLTVLSKANKNYVMPFQSNLTLKTGNVSHHPDIGV